MTYGTSSCHIVQQGRCTSWILRSAGWDTQSHRLHHLGAAINPPVSQHHHVCFAKDKCATHVAVPLSDAVPMDAATVGLEVVGDFDGDSVAPLGVDSRPCNMLVAVMYHAVKQHMGQSSAGALCRWVKAYQ